MTYAAALTTDDHGYSTPVLRRIDDPELGLAAAWKKASLRAKFFEPRLEDYLAASGQADRIVVTCPKAGGHDLVLPFVQWTRAQKFTVGERRIGSVRLSALDLVNPWMAEGHSPDAIARALQAAVRGARADALFLGQIPEDSDLRRALNRSTWPSHRMALGRTANLRWLIDLPDSFGEYLAMLSSSTRQSARRKMRKLEKDFAVDLEVVTDASQVDRFLREGEKISRLTYQWNVGQRLEHTEAKRQQFIRYAEQGRLRSYLVSLDGEVRAFFRGTIEGNLYHYQTPGFDPAFGRTSIGTVLLLYAIRDLIENTSCRVFDFGRGGDETGYKSSFGTRSIACNSYMLVQMDRPRGLGLLLGQTGLNQAKRLADQILRDSAVRQFLRQKLRRYQS